MPTVKPLWKSNLFRRSCAVALVILASGASLAANATQFVFVDGYDCTATGVDESYCQSAQPKKWLLSEKQLVARTIAALKNHQLKNFFQTLERTGFTKLYRTSFAPKPIANSKFVRSPLPARAWVNGARRMIAFNDRFFEQRQGVSRSMSLFASRELGLLHELAHAFDYGRGKISEDVLFAKTFGWTKSSGRWVTSIASPSIINEAMNRYVSFVKSGEQEAAYRIDVTVGQHHGMPSSYSLTNPGECFADLVAFIYLDRAVWSYLDSAKIAVVRQLVEQN